MSMVDIFIQWDAQCSTYKSVLYVLCNTQNMNIHILQDMEIVVSKKRKSIAGLAVLELLFDIHHKYKFQNLLGVRDTDWIAKISCDGIVLYVITYKHRYFV